MRETKRNYNVPPSDKHLVDSVELQILLCCGSATAVKIGEAAGGRVKIGRRVLWNVKKIQEYLDAISV